MKVWICWMKPWPSSWTNLPCNWRQECAYSSKKENTLLNEPRIYRYSTIRLVLIIILLALLGIAPFMILGGQYSFYALIGLAFIGLVMMISVLSFTRST